MNIYEMTKLGGKGKKKSRLTISIECETRRNAKNIQLCVMELLKGDMNIDRKRIKASVGGSDGV